MYECKKATSDSLVEADKAVGKEKYVAFERPPNGEFLKGGRALEMGVSKWPR